MGRGPGEDAFVYHGGALDVARRLFPNAPKPWIDLSTGVNPHPYPLPELAAEAWTRLPEATALAGLEAAAAARYRAKPEQTVAGPGSQALVQALARLAPKGPVGVLRGSYTGHAEAFRAAGADVAEVDALPDLERFQVAVVVNPNNPDGRVTPFEKLMRLHARAIRVGGLLVVDEAFADFGDAPSLAPALPSERIVVLRSFGKAYGLAGLRLGFAIASPDVEKRLRNALGPWPVSAPALAIGTKALADGVWIEDMRELLGKEAVRLDELLKSHGWRVVGGTSFFRLAANAEAQAAFRRLLAVGILTRSFAEAPHRLRFGIPAEPAHWARLEAALRN
jgi:cobalamin biosynthetic protein CobC